MRDVEKARVSLGQTPNRKSHLGLIAGVLFGSATVATGVPIWNEMSRQINARVESEVATRLHQATKDERRAGFVDGVCASREIGVLNLGARRGTSVEATGSYSPDAESARDEIAMALEECPRSAG